MLPDSLSYEGAAHITTMLDRLWYEQDRDWEVVRTSADEPVHEKVRHENLIVLGAPGQNALINELMRDHPARGPGGGSDRFRTGMTIRTASLSGT